MDQLPVEEEVRRFTMDYPMHPDLEIGNKFPDFELPTKQVKFENCPSSCVASRVSSFSAGGISAPRTVVS